METLAPLDQEALTSVVNIVAQIPPSTSWEYVYQGIREGFARHGTGLEAAVWWPQPEGFVPLTSGAAQAFEPLVGSRELEELNEQTEFLPIPEVPGAFRLGILANRQTYGQLLLAGKGQDGADRDLLAQLGRLLAVPIGLVALGVQLGEEIAKRTSTDKITGLWNRVYFNERFREECERLVRSKETGAVAIVSLDNFTALSRTMPPDEVQALQAQIGQVVRQVVRQTDWAVRWDGYDLLFYFPSTSSDAAVEVLKRFAKRLVATNPILEPLMGVSSTLETTSPRALVQLATRRLDLARKDGGRRVICFATPGGGLQFYRET